MWYCLVGFVLTAQSQKPEVVFTTGHTDMVKCMDVSPNGSWLASGSTDKSLKIVEISSGKELRTFAGNDGVAEMVKFSPDGELIAGLFANDEVKVWNIANGSLLVSHSAVSNGLGLDFVNDGKTLLFLGIDRSPVLLPLNGEQPTLLAPKELFRMCAHHDAKSFYALNISGEIVRYALPDGRELAKTKIFNEFVFAPSPMLVDPNGKFVAIAFDDHKIHVFDANTLKEIALLEGHKSRIWSVTSNLNGSKIWSCEHNGDIIEWSQTDWKRTKYFTPGQFNVMCIQAHTNEDFLFVTNGRDIQYVNPTTTQILREFKPRGSKVQNMALLPGSKRLVTASTDITLKVWNLETGKIDQTITGFWPVVGLHDGNTIVGMNGHVKLSMWDVNTGEQRGELNTENELIQHLALSPDGKWLAGAGFMGVVKIWNLDERQLEHRLTGHVGGIYNLAFSPNGKYLATSGMDGSVRIWDWSSGVEVKVMDNAHDIIASGVRFSPDGNFLASTGWDKKLKIWSTGDWSLVKTIEGHDNIIVSMDWHSNGKYIATGAGNNSVGKADNSVRIWDAATGAEVCVFRAHTDWVHRVIFDSEDPSTIYSCGNDGSVKVWDFTTCTEKLSLYAVNRADHILVSPDGYYMASRDALSGISFRDGSKLFPFEQYDLWLNRPDIVLAALDKSPNKLLRAYEYAYQRRKAKEGFADKEPGGDYALPQIAITGKTIPLITKDSVVKITILAKDEKYLLERIRVSVNGVPLPDAGVKGLSAKKLKSIEYEFLVRLTPGENVFSISAMNEKGTESLPVIVQVLRDGGNNKADLYLIALGVSKYADERFNLNYAAKDVRDVSDLMGDDSTLYSEIKSLLITDQDVGAAVLDDVRAFLHDARPEDVVVLYLAGHGVLNYKFEYYFATYPMDFEAPEKYGVPYSELEKLLASLTPRKKALFMDTCHSGDLDKSEMESTTRIVADEGEIKFRNAGVQFLAVDAFGYGNSVELMQDLFTELSEGTGSTVVSSSGGVEFSMESHEWQNGLFTFALLEGIRLLKADLNYDGKIMLSELRNYVYRRVTQLSNGNQRPGSREENISVDFRMK